MTNPTQPAPTREAAARERSRSVVQRSARPGQRRYGPDLRSAPSSPLRSAARACAPLPAELTVQRAAGDAGEVVLRGHATSYEQPYEMWDFFGPYTEVVSAGAGALSLSRSPNVVFLLNHRGIPLAKTTGAETLELSEDDTGLLSVARPEMRLVDAQSVVTAVEARLIDEMSFAFMIERGVWSPDYTEYRIDQYDIDRGDTSAVTFGANPWTDIGAERAPADGGATRRGGLDPARRAAARTVLSEHLIRA